MTRVRYPSVLLLTILGVATLSGGLAYLAITIDDEATTADDDLEEVTHTAEGAIGEVHESGITGENVSVGVLDVTGFDTDGTTLSSRLNGSRQFGEDVRPVESGDSHGTATAATIARIAPDAELYLGTFETADDYAAGLEWMLEQDVDVVVAPVAYAGTLGDGNSRMATATTEATEQGLIVVAPAGNLGSGHWSGEYTSTERERHAFENGSINEIDGTPEQASFWLTWDDPSERYRIELHRFTSTNETELIARSVSYDEDEIPNQQLTVQLDDDRYGIVISGPENATETTIRVASPTHSLSEARPAGSVAAPAAAPGAISVGAFDPITDTIEPFSSRGPTSDGRLGVTVVAPSSQPSSGDPFVGTSASAAFVGGVTALTVAAGPELEPDEVRWSIATSAAPLNRTDTKSGHGKIDPQGAVIEAAERDGESPPELRSSE